MGWDSRTVGVPGSSNVLSTALAHAGLRGVVHIFSDPSGLRALAWAWVESTPLGCVVRPVVWWPCCGWRPVHEEELGWCPLEWVRAVVASQGGPPGQLLWGGVLRVGGDSGVGSSGLSGFFRRVLGERRGGPGAGVRRDVLRVPLHGGVSGAVRRGFHTLLLEVLRTCPTILSFDNKVLRRVKVLHDFLEALSLGHVRKVELRVVLVCDLLPPVRRFLSSASALLLVHPASFGDLVHLVLLVVASASNLVDRCRQYLEYSTSIIIISLCY